MNKNRTFVQLVLLGLGLFGLVGFYALPLAHFEGDLTRITPVSESMFGWTKKQPAIPPLLLRQSDIRTADVFVIGDSFSAHGVWQAELVKAGLQVHTEEWGVMPYLCGDVGSQIRRAGFKGKWIIIETVERNLAHRINDSLRCSAGHYGHPAVALSSPTPPPVYVERQANDYSGRISVGINVLINSVLFPYWKKQPNNIPLFMNSEVAIRPVVNGCALFSHQECEYALFYAEESNADNSGQAIEGIKTLNARFTGYSPVWVVVPNKTTAYIYPQKQLWGEIARQDLGPDMLSVTKAAVGRSLVDLYPGNNTHFSTEGYLLMGQAVMGYLNQTLDQGRRP